MAPKATAAGLAFKLIQAALTEGVDPSELLPFEVPNDASGLESRIPHESHVVLWEKVMRRVRDPGFPIRAGVRSTPKDYDAIGLACMTRATLGEALRQAVRFSCIWTNASTMAFRIDDGMATLSFVVDDYDRLGVRCGSESAVAQMLNAGRVMTGVEYVPQRIRFRHAKPRATTEHERHFNGPVEWGASRTEIVIDAKLLELPLVKADDALAAFFERYTVELLGRFAEPENLQHRLRTVLASELRSGLPTLESIAARLATSTRTLRRRLQEDGTTFQQVLDEVRCELAKRYLREQDLGVGSVAFLLGFSDPSAFHRAFKRWTGTTPLAFRQSDPRTAA